MVKPEHTENTASDSITSKDLPAILIGGPPHAGKSVLTYNLTRALRDLNRYDTEIFHYVFRASTDVEGDWFLQGNFETVCDIRQRVKGNYQKWNDTFRTLVCRDLPYRFMPFLVDVGGIPTDKDSCIFENCTHSILLLKDGNDDEVELSQNWLRLAKEHNLKPIAELRSLQKGASHLTPTSQKSYITGTITNLEREPRVENLDGDEVFEALVERVSELFLFPDGSFVDDRLERWHRSLAPIHPVIDLSYELHRLLPGNKEWTSGWLTRLLAKLPSQTPMSVYGRAPNWLYGALALHAGTQPFHQFDARLGWIEPPTLETNASEQFSKTTIDVKTEIRNDEFIVFIHPFDHYLDFNEADKLMFPVPPSECGVVITGKLPLWLFTALARFYVQRKNVPWIALNDARDNKPVVIYSRPDVVTHSIGNKLLPLPKYGQG